MTDEVRIEASGVRIETSPVGPVVYPPHPAGSVLVYLHSDRYLGSAPESALGLAGHLAARTGVVVVCPRYRSSFPDALKDAHAGYRFGAQVLGSPGSGLVVAGERLGAGLAAALLIRLRDVGDVLPGGAVLVSALLDFSLEAPSLQLNEAADPTFRLGELRRRAARYAAGTAVSDPLLSPLHANLHGLPPVQLLAAGNDVLVDDSLAFATRAARSGVTVDLRVRSDEAGLRAGLADAVAAFVGERAGSSAEPAGSSAERAGSLAGWSGKRRLRGDLPRCTDSLDQGDGWPTSGRRSRPPTPPTGPQLTWGAACTTARWCRRRPSSCRCGWSTGTA